MTYVFRQLLRVLSSKSLDLLYHGGDLVQRGSIPQVLLLMNVTYIEQDWAIQWMDALQVLQSEDGKLIPISFCKGNHDNRKSPYAGIPSYRFLLTLKVILGEILHLLRHLVKFDGFLLILKELIVNSMNGFPMNCSLNLLKMLCLE